MVQKDEARRQRLRASFVCSGAVCIRRRRVIVALLLEVQLERELDLTAGVRSVQQTVSSNRTTLTAGGAGGAYARAINARAIGVPPGIRNAEDWRVGQVHELRRECDVHLFPDREPLGQVDIGVSEMRSAHSIAP